MQLQPNYALILLHRCSIFRIDLKLNNFTTLFWAFTPYDPTEYVWFLSYFTVIFALLLCTVPPNENRSSGDKFLYSYAYESYKCFYKILTQQNGLNFPDHIKYQSGVHILLNLYILCKLVKKVPCHV